MSDTRKDFSKMSSNVRQSPPLNLPCLPQISKSNPFYILDSGRKIGPLCQTVGRINSKQMGPLYHPRKFQDPIQLVSPTIYSSDKSESVFLPLIMRRNIVTSPATGSGKGTRSGNSRFLLLAIFCTQRTETYIP